MSKRIPSNSEFWGWVAVAVGMALGAFIGSKYRKGLLDKLSSTLFSVATGGLIGKKAEEVARTTKSPYDVKDV